MATGRKIQLTRQIGEHLVAAELGRMGFLAAPFAGNVPNFDLLVAREDGLAVPIQVKAMNGPSWQFNASSFLEIAFDGDVQTVLGPKKTNTSNLVYVLVALNGPGTDDFYTLRFKDLQLHFARAYKGGTRPNNPTSTHCAVWPKELSKFKNWEALLKALRWARGLTPR